MISFNYRLYHYLAHAFPIPGQLGIPLPDHVRPLPIQPIPQFMQRVKFIPARADYSILGVFYPRTAVAPCQAYPPKARAPIRSMLHSGAVLKLMNRENQICPTAVPLRLCLPLLRCKRILKVNIGTALVAVERRVRGLLFLSQGIDLDISQDWSMV